jgi:23S rRNA pseudouridine1911/1915/1917 synthase
MQILPLIVEDPADRLDVWLSENLEDLSRSRIQELIRDGSIRVNGRVVKPGVGLKTGDQVDVTVPDAIPVELIAEPIPLDVIYEDADIIVINKQAGLVVHPAVGHPSGTLVNALLYHCHDLRGIGGELRPGIVHRLDRDTTGVLIAAKHQVALELLTEMFKTRAVTKEYRALVWGAPRPDKGRIETLIGRSQHDRKRMSTQTDRGRPAVTWYETIATRGPISLLSLRIETGRTHQIRVHMIHRHCPVVGDPEYGLRHPRELAVPAERQMLHAARLALEHPILRRPMVFEAPLPADMRAVWESLAEPATVDRLSAKPPDDKS